MPPMNLFKGHYKERVYDEAATMSHEHKMTRTSARGDVIAAEMQT